MIVRSIIGKILLNPQAVFEHVSFISIIQLAILERHMTNTSGMISRW